MENLRRKVILSALGLPAISLAPPARAARLPLTAATAEDPVSRFILSRPPIRTLQQNISANQDPGQLIAAQTSIVLESNFARYRTDRLARTMDGLTDDEIQLLAVIYMRSVHSYGLQPLLLDMFAKRLSPARLGRLSRYFGFAPVYAAVVSQAPEKSDRFQAYSSPSFPTPGPWSSVPGPARRVGVKASIGDSDWGYRKAGAGMLDYTLYEIYLSYRTAPIGSLSVSAALYETASFAGRYLVAAYYTGYAVGTGLSSLIQTYAPGLHSAIGSAIYTAVNWLSNAGSTGSIQQIGQAQMNVFPLFCVGPVYSPYFPSYGDFGVTYEWSVMQGGGGGCGYYCPILE